MSYQKDQWRIWGLIENIVECKAQSPALSEQFTLRLIENIVECKGRFAETVQSLKND